MPERLRVAMVVGTLGRAGAEKQLSFIAASLRGQPVELRIYSLTRGEHYEQVLRDLGCQPVWIGRRESPPLRLVELTRLLRAWRPHVVHSTHFYTNLYAAGAGRLSGALSVGASRADPRTELGRKFWGPWLARSTDGMIANSYNARERLLEFGLPPGRVRVLTNVIDLQAFDQAAAQPVEPALSLPGEVRVAMVGRMHAVKRVDRFLRVLQAARETVPGLHGLLIGGGPVMAEMQALAARMGLESGVSFLGDRGDVPALLRQAHILAHTSDREGFPNVILEGMAAGLPVVVTPAGDAPRIVQDGETGYLVPFEDEAGFAARLVELARDEALRARMGAAGRRLVKQKYQQDGLGERLLRIYADLAGEVSAHRRIQPLVEAALGSR